jgi:transposase
MRRCVGGCARRRRTGACGLIWATSEEREEIRKLRKEVFELRRANEILKTASVSFATELDADRPK